MYLKWVIQKIKLRKLRTLDGYIDYLNNYDMKKIPRLSVGSTHNLKEPDYENMFSYLSEYDKIKEKYSLNNVVEGENDFCKALSLMQWLTESTYYNGQQCLFHKLLPDDTLSILEFSYKKTFKSAINCRYKAIALTDILLSFGIKAYPVAMADVNKDGNHLTVQVNLSDEKKWVLLDPSFNTYFTDDKGNLLNAFEIRKLYLGGKEPVINGYNFNGTQECFDTYKKVFIESCMTNLSTWNDNTISGRHSRTLKNRKEFDCKLPL